MDEILHAIECDCQECLDKWKELFNYRPPSNVVVGFETAMNARDRYEFNKIMSDRIQKMEMNENG